MMRTILLILFLALTVSVVHAQTPEPCGTMERDRVLREQFPERGTLDEFETVLQKKIREISLRPNNGRTKAVVTIPVVVHVVHNGEAVGTGTNISRAQVESQIAVLNEDFRRLTGSPGFNDSPVGADIEIEFCLSPLDPSGATLSEPGIHRYRGNKAFWTDTDVDGTLKPQTIWNPNLFYNIWTVNFGGTSSSLLGYAQFPDQSGLPGLNPSGGPATTDGVVCKYTSFGSNDKGSFPVLQAPYDKGRTLTHETGHWLGLRHIWGDGPCGNDFVDDTPTAHGQNSGCPITRVSCDNVSNEMPQNYMDYSDHGCMNIFTKGQKARMLAVMELSPRRKSLLQSNVCSNLAAAPPVANFTSDKQFVLKGGEVIFADLSTNFPTEWSWSFEGGNPATSVLQNPQIKYPNPGIYRVTLVSSNSLGDSDPFVITDYVTVSEEGLCGQTPKIVGEYTPSLLKLSTVGNYTGYVAGHNSPKIKAFSEFFSNPQGYKYISGVEIMFGKAYTTKETTKAVVTVWNARGAQNGPGSVIERKEVLFKQIKADVDAGQPTLVVFDRETPVFSRAYHVGVELTYTGDSLAVISTAEGEALAPTSWVQSSAGVWAPYAIAYGLNIALDISPIVGMNPSVQVSTSKLLISPGEEVILNARGASIFVWNSTDNVVQNVAGPQLIVHPVQTTTYETKGSGLELCNASTLTTVYVSGEITGTPDLNFPLKVFPNPGQDKIYVQLSDGSRGPVNVKVITTTSTHAKSLSFNKSQDLLEAEVDAAGLPAGLYIITVQIGDRHYHAKWIKER